MKKQGGKQTEFFHMDDRNAEHAVSWQKKFYALLENHPYALIEILDNDIIHFNTKAGILLNPQGKSDSLTLENVFQNHENIHSDLNHPIVVETKLKSQKLAVNVIFKLSAYNYLLEIKPAEKEKTQQLFEIDFSETTLLLQSILDTIPTRVFWKDNNLKFIGCNKKYLEDTGLSSFEELIGKTDYDMAWKEQAPLYQKDDMEVINKDTPKLDIEEPQTTPQGNLIWLRTNKIPLKNHKGEIVGVLGCYDDITELKNTLLELEIHKNNLENLVNKRAEEVIRKNRELQQSESKFRSFIEQSNIGICLIDEKGIITEWNKAMSEMYRIPRDIYINRHIFEFDHDFLPARKKNKKEISKIRKTLDDYLSNTTDEIFAGEFEKEIEGEPRYIHSRIFPIRTETQRIFGQISIDISENKAAELELENYKQHLEQLVYDKTQDLRESEAKMRLVMQSVPLAYYSYEVSSPYKIWYSEHIEILTGFKIEELKQDRLFWESRINKDDFKKVRGTFDNLAPNIHTSCEYRWLDANDQEIWIFDQAVLIEATENHPEQIIGCFLDITERKESEKALIESESNYHEIFNSSSDAIFIYDADTGRIEDVNDTMLKMYGTSYDKIMKSKLDDFIFGKPPFDITGYEKHFQIAREKGIENFEWLARRENNSLFWTEITLKKAIINGEIKIMAVVRNIDEKKKVQSQITYRHDFEKLLFNFSSRFINVHIKDVDKNIEMAFQEICEFTQTDLAFIFRFENTSNTLDLTHFWKKQNIKVNKVDLQSVPFNDNDWHTSQIKSNQVVKIEKPGDLPDKAQVLRSISSKYNINSILTVPMIFEEQIIGFLGLANENIERKWLNDEISLMRIVGQIFISAIKRKESVQTLLESEQSYREIFNAANEAILILDLENAKILDANNAMLQMLGLTYPEALNSSLRDISSGSVDYTEQEVLEYFQEVKKDGPKMFEWQTKRKDGTVFWIEVSLKIAEIKGKKRMLSVIRDISERKHAREVLKESEEKYRLLIEGQTDLVIKVDTKNRFLFVSPSYCEFFGKKEDELIGHAFLPLVHKDDQELTTKAMENLYKPPHTCYIEQRAYSKHGWRWIAWSDKAVLDKNNMVKEIIGIGRDITYQKGVEEALRRSEDRFRSIVQHLSDIVLIIDAKTNIIYDTPSIKKILGYDEGFLVGKNSVDLIHPEDYQQTQKELENLLKDKNYISHTELRIKHASGNFIYCEVIAMNMLQHPSIRGLVLTLRNISERKLFEKRILDAVIKTEENERERFAKNLHDDLGPLLSSIKLYINSLNTSNKKEKQEFIIKQLNDVVKEAITTTKDVSNDLSPHILINYGLVSAIGSFLNKVPEGMKTEFNTDLTTERYSNTIENSFYRIIKELINNTLKHAKASNIYIELNEIGQNLMLIYFDDGIGFEPEKVSNDRHTGMGLSNIISRAKSLDGIYDFESFPGKGFKFTINIPINQSV